MALKNLCVSVIPISELLRTFCERIHGLNDRLFTITEMLQAHVHLIWECCHAILECGLQAYTKH